MKQSQLLSVNKFCLMFSSPNLPPELLTLILTHLVNELETIKNFRLSAPALKNLVDSNLYLLNTRLEIIFKLRNSMSPELRKHTDQDFRIWSLYLSTDTGDGAIVEQAKVSGKSYGDIIFSHYQALKEFIKKQPPWHSIKSDEDLENLETAFRSLSKNIISARLLLFNDKFNDFLYTHPSCLLVVSEHNFVVSTLFKDFFTFDEKLLRTLGSLSYLKEEIIFKMAGKHQNSALQILKEPNCRELLFLDQPLSRSTLTALGELGEAQEAAGTYLAVKDKILYCQEGVETLTQILEAHEGTFFAFAKNEDSINRLVSCIVFSIKAELVLDKIKQKFHLSQVKIEKQPGQSRQCFFKETVARLAAALEVRKA